MDVTDSSLEQGLSRNATEELSEALGSLAQSKTALYSCGGLVQLKAAASTTSEDEHGRHLEPFSLYWDTAEGGGTERITFPVGDDRGSAQLGKLSEACQPASFGYQGQDVVDPSYRKATKLDRSQFAVNFCPYEIGIIDTITQLLHPDVTNMRNGVLAELYKLNIYSGPSGFFKPHVDTPRSRNQFGSLVVSLPCRHEGGQLVIRHGGNENVFDWSTSKTGQPALQWAAFYSDCEHEVKEVAEGHRVTLTYNLYSVPGVGDLAVHCPVLDVKSIPLYGMIGKLLENEEFMPTGGTLGLFCYHAYAHHSDGLRDLLPRNLKGIDMAIYSIFRAHKLQVSVQAILDDEEAIEEDRARLQYDSDESSGGSEPKSHRDMPHWETAYRRSRHLGGVEFNDYGRYDDMELHEVLDTWPEQMQHIHWIQRPSGGSREVGFVHLAYGNETSVAWKYTFAAILVSIPNWAERETLAKSWP